MFMTLCPNCRTMQKEGTVCGLCNCPVNVNKEDIVAGMLFKAVGDAGYAMANMDCEFPTLFQEIGLEPKNTTKVPF